MELPRLTEKHLSRESAVFLIVSKPRFGVFGRVPLSSTAEPRPCWAPLEGVFPATTATGSYLVQKIHVSRPNSYRDARILGTHDASASSVSSSAFSRHASIMAYVIRWIAQYWIALIRSSVDASAETRSLASLSASA